MALRVDVVDRGARFMDRMVSKELAWRYYAAVALSGMVEPPGKSMQDDRWMENVTRKASRIADLMVDEESRRQNTKE